MILVLFDCDGTIIDSALLIHTCMVQTFGEAGIKPPRLRETRAIIGLSLEVAMARLTGIEDGGQIARLADGYRQRVALMRSGPDIPEPLFDGMAALLEVLRQRDDLLMGVVTGKSRRGLQAVLSMHGLADRFVCTRTADDCPSKPHPAMVLECCRDTGVEASRCLVVGDTVFDMEMAAAAGAGAIGVDWGYHDRQNLWSAGAQAVIESPAELLNHISGGS